MPVWTNPDTGAQIERPIPVTGTETHRAATYAAGKMLQNEFHATTQGRAFLASLALSSDVLIGLVVHPDAASETELLATNATSPRGCWPADFRFRTDTNSGAGSMWLCISNHGTAISDWFEFGSGSGGTMTAAAIRDALASLAPGSRLSYNSLDDTPPAYSLPTASASVLGGVKIGTGLAIVGGVLSVSSIAASFLVLTFLSMDNFDSYADGTVIANGGVSWAAPSTSADPMDSIMARDNFDGYTDATTIASGGFNWAAAQETPADPMLSVLMRDNFDDYADGTTTINGGYGWAASATAAVITTP